MATITSNRTITIVAANQTEYTQILSYLTQQGIVQGPQWTSVVQKPKTFEVDLVEAPWVSQRTVW